MTKAELKELMEYLSAVDNRQVTTDKMKAWFDILGYLDYAIAKESLLQVQRDPNIPYIEPKHIIAYSFRVKEQIQTEQRRAGQKEETPIRTGTPMPKCHHGIGILLCDPCCRQAALQAGLIS
jgi:hypothetical protein